MPAVSVDKHVAAPPQRVWSIITDLEGWVETISGITKIERLDRGSGFGVGTRWRETRRLFGKEAAEEMEVTALEPLDSYTTEASSRGIHYVTSLEIAPEGDGTRLSMTIEGRPQRAMAKLMAATIGRLFMGATRKALEKDLADIARAAGG